MIPNNKKQIQIMYTKTEIDEKETALNNTINQTKKDLQNNIDAKANSSDVYTKTETDEKMNAKQDKLIAGTNITIANNTISAKDTTYSTATSSADGLMSKSDKSKLDNLFNSIYPVGSIYMSVNSTNPANLFGGTWEQIKDRFLLSCGNTYTNGAIGGEATHTLTIDEIPPHFHNCKTYSGNNVDGKVWSFKSINNSLEGGIGTDSVGGGQPHNNMPPYLVVYMWKRTA